MAGTCSTVKKWRRSGSSTKASDGLHKPVGHSKPESGKVVEVAAGLVFRGGKLLITQRYPDAHLGGLWEFPGGKRECDETFAQCLARELREELGIEVEVAERIEVVAHDYPDKKV